jgi:hypothetical protein
MRTTRQHPQLSTIPGNVSGTSGAQATLVLLLLIFIVVFLARTTIGDAIVSTANEFSKFRVWGTDNRINGSSSGDIAMSAYNAHVVSVDMPAQMAHGGTYTATITMKNAGIANWYADGASTVVLGAVGGSGGDAYRFARSSSFPMTSGTIVRKDNTYTFRYTIVAPTPGQYLLEFRMISNDAGTFGEIAGKSIRVIPTPTPTPVPTPAPTPAPTPKPTPVPTPTPPMSYLAYGKFALYDLNGNQMIGGPWEWVYSGPLISNNHRSSYFSEPSWSYPDWDIGGPNGQYYVYKPGCIGSGSFSMNNGGNKGTIIFRMI